MIFKKGRLSPRDKREYDNYGSMFMVYCADRGKIRTNRHEDLVIFKKDRRNRTLYEVTEARGALTIASCLS